MPFETKSNLAMSSIENTYSIDIPQPSLHINFIETETNSIDEDDTQNDIGHSFSLSSVPYNI